MTRFPQSLDDGKAKKLPRRWYLIQRFKRRADPQHHTGVDRTLSVDYMGAAEFEDGSVQRSVQRIKQLGEQRCLQFKTIQIRSMPVHVVVHKEADLDALAFWLEALASGSQAGGVYLKEPTWFDEHFAVYTSTFAKMAQKSRQEVLAWLVLDQEYPVFWSVDWDVAQAWFDEVEKAWGIDGTEISIRDTVFFRHLGRLHKGRVSCIYERHAIIECDDADLRGRQRVAYADVRKP